MPARVVVGVDLGGSKILSGLSDLQGKVLAEVRLDTCPESGPEGVLHRIAGSVHELLQQAGLPRERLAGVAVGAPGPLNPVTGVVREAPNLGWRDFPLRDRLAALLQVPVWLDNDANLAALGEQRVGLRDQWPDLLYVTVGTGIGGGIIINGDIYHGAAGGAAEFGHMTIVPEGGPGCGCGNHGCLESLASGGAMEREARRRARDGQAEALLQAAEGEPDNITARLVAELARQGDAPSLAIVRMAAYYLGIGLGNLVNLFNPAVIVLGGGITAGMGDLLLPGAEAEMRRRAMCTLAGDVILRASVLGARAGLVGSLVLARRRVNGGR